MLIIALLSISGYATNDVIYTSQDNQKLEDMLVKYPEADANGDGILTATEAKDYREKQNKSEKKDRPDAIYPTAKLQYGQDPAQYLNFWKVNSSAKTPVIVHIHGGGFLRNDPKTFLTPSAMKKLEAAEVSYVSIQYRFISETVTLPEVLRDCARAIQYLRWNADELGIDKNAIALFGSSAGGNAAAWIAMRDDMADPENTDPVLRESTRVKAVYTIVPSKTMDLWQWPNIIPDMTDDMFRELLIEHHFNPDADPESPELKKLRMDVDTGSYASNDDPPIMIINDDVLSSLVHNPYNAQALYEVCKSAGIRTELYMKELINNYSQAPEELDWLIAELTVNNNGASTSTSAATIAPTPNTSSN